MVSIDDERESVFLSKIGRKIVEHLNMLSQGWDQIRGASGGRVGPSNNKLAEV